MNAKWFDAYTLKARWAPAAFVATPVLALALSTFELSAVVGLTGPATAALILGLLASELARSRGRLLQLRLVEQWDGLPTTRALRATPSPMQGLRARRRNQVAALSGNALPSYAEQVSEPVETDKIIARAVRVAIAQLRHDEAPSASILQSENTSYGFRRNLAGLRMFGLVVAILSILAGSLAALNGLITWNLALPMLAIQTAMAICWLLVPTHGWVKDQAEIFAERFFDAIEVYRPEQAAR